VINSRDYVRPGPGPGPGPSESIGNVDQHERRVVTRKLQQAMIPGPELVRVQQVQVLGLGQQPQQQPQQRGLNSPTDTPSAANNQVILG
jgi:hypothetical protein